jgi:hypothetical protein
MAMPTLFLSTASPPSADRATRQDHGDWAEQGRPRKTRSPGLVLQAREQRQCAFRARPGTQSLPAVNNEIELVLVIGKGGRHHRGRRTAAHRLQLREQRRHRARLAVPHVAMGTRQVVRHLRALRSLDHDFDVSETSIPAVPR